jgi:hypothetical protein
MEVAMPKKPIPSTWSLIRPPQPEPALLTDAELAKVNTLYDPIEAILFQYVEDSPEYPFDTILEALARLTDFYEGMQAYVDAEIEKDIAAEEADA